MVSETTSLKIPLIIKGDNKILTDGAVTGEQSPVVKIEFRTMGKGERITATIK